MKNIKTNVTENIDICNKKNITKKVVIKELITLSIFVAILSTLLFKYVFMPIIEPIIGTIAQSCIPLIAGTTIFINAVLQLAELYERNKEQKNSQKEIVELQEELKSIGLKYTKKEIKNANILEIENKKDIIRKNGVKTKRHKVTNYIIIDSKTKLSIIKETITYYKKLKEEIVETYLLEKQDLTSEGITDKNGFLTEKGKALILNKNN